MTGGDMFGIWNHYRQKGINDELLYTFGHSDCAGYRRRSSGGEREMQL